MVHWPLWLLRRLSQLLLNLLLSVHNIRSNCRSSGQRIHFVRGEWSALHVDNVRYGVSVHVLLLLQIQVKGPIFVEGKAMQRLLCPLLLRTMCLVPGVSRAQEPRLRNGHWVACQHG
ncbi:hypothetical protein V6N12_041422 [Hibiscus sabdariffa]|uniref:Secreted protein n=1 Tax=Hibiscus sabdariffa TaxID=183260 RepID=A0ABR2E8K6_9ROSI